MAKTVIALYDDLDQARNAVVELVDHGFDRDQVSLMANDPEGKFANALSANTDQSNTNIYELETDEYSTEAAKDAGIGALLGGVAGLLVGLGIFLTLE